MPDPTVTPPQPISATRRKYMPYVAIASAFFIGGLFYGFPALMPTLRAHNALSQVCGTGGTVCRAMDNTLAMVMSIGFFTAAVTPLVLLYFRIVEKYGPKYIAVTASAFVLIGLLCVAFSTPNFNGYAVGAGIVGAASGMVLVSVPAYAHLFDVALHDHYKRLFWVAFDLSALILAIIGVVASSGLGGLPTTTIIFLAFFVVPTGIACAHVLPSWEQLEAFRKAEQAEQARKAAEAAASAEAERLAREGSLVSFNSFVWVVNDEELDIDAPPPAQDAADNSSSRSSSPPPKPGAMLREQPVGGDAVADDAHVQDANAQDVVISPTDVDEVAVDMDEKAGPPEAKVTAEPETSASRADALPAAEAAVQHTKRTSRVDELDAATAAKSPLSPTSPGDAKQLARPPASANRPPPQPQIQFVHPEGHSVQSPPVPAPAPAVVVSLKDQLRSRRFIAWCVVTCIVMLQFNFLMSTVDAQMTQLGQSSGHYSRIFGWILPFGGVAVVAAILVPLYLQHLVFAAAMVLLAAGQAILSAIPVLGTQPAAFALFALFRFVSFYGLRVNFSEAFGVVNGPPLFFMAVAIGQVFAYVQWGLLHWAFYAGSFYPPYTLVACLTVPMAIAAVVGVGCDLKPVFGRK